MQYRKNIASKKPNLRHTDAFEFYFDSGVG